MNEWKVIFATVVIFGAGVISGGLLVNYADLSHLKAVPSMPVQVEASNSVSQISTNNSSKSAVAKPRMPEILTKQFVDRLEFELQLTLGQRADVEKIIADGQDEARKAFQNIRQDARQKIRERLTPSQKKEFDELFKQSHPVKRTPSDTNVPAILPATNSPAVMATNTLAI